MIKLALWIGTVTGIFLGGFMLVMESLTSKKVYTLLMNVDFIPIFSGKSLPILMEWLFHLIISWIIAYLFLLYCDKIGRYELAVALIISILAAGSYFPLTLLAEKETPSIADPIAIGVWLIGHILYGYLLYYVMKRSTR